jgi:hypothetical protein
MMLDIVANNNWKDPYSLAPVLLTMKTTWMKEYLQLDGMVYKLVPVKQLFLKMVVH